VPRSRTDTVPLSRQRWDQVPRSRADTVPLSRQRCDQVPRSRTDTVPLSRQRWDQVHLSKAGTPPPPRFQRQKWDQVPGRRADTAPSYNSGKIRCLKVGQTQSPTTIELRSGAKGRADTVRSGVRCLCEAVKSNILVSPLSCKKNNWYEKNGSDCCETNQSEFYLMT
jgi:hypothetical protein